MAITFATRPLRQSWVGGGKKVRRTDVTLDASYVNGTGYAITKAQLGLGSGDTIDLVYPMSPSVGGFVPNIAITATGITLKMFKTGSALSGALAEAATNEAGLNTLVVSIVCIGN